MLHLWISLVIVIVMCFFTLSLQQGFPDDCPEKVVWKKQFSSLRHPLLHLLRAHQDDDNCKSLITWLIFQNYLLFCIHVYSIRDSCLWFVGTVSLQFSFLCVDPFTLYLYLPDCNIGHIVYFNVLLLSGIGLRWLTLVILWCCAKETHRHGAKYDCDQSYYHYKVCSFSSE